MYLEEERERVNGWKSLNKLDHTLIAGSFRKKRLGTL